MLSPLYTAQFRRDVKKCQQRGKDMEKLKTFPSATPKTLAILSLLGLSRSRNICDLNMRVEEAMTPGAIAAGNDCARAATLGFGPLFASLSLSLSLSL
jgi:hypothetical protein